MASEDYSLQFKEPAEPSHSHSLASTHTHGSAGPTDAASTMAPPPMQRQGSVSKIAHVAKNLIKSPAEEKEEKSLQKTVSEEARKGEVDVGVMEV